MDSGEQGFLLESVQVQVCMASWTPNVHPASTLARTPMLTAARGPISHTQKALGLTWELGQAERTPLYKDL